LAREFFSAIVLTRYLDFARDARGCFRFDVMHYHHPHFASPTHDSAISRLSILFPIPSLLYNSTALLTQQYGVLAASKAGD
jgi:hypothetical protein